MSKRTPKEYKIENNVPITPHGKSTVYSLFLQKLKVEQSFMVPESDYSRANSARSHFQTKHKHKVRFASRLARDPETLEPIIINGERQYRFWRVK